MKIISFAYATHTKTLTMPAMSEAVEVTEGAFDHASHAYTYR